MTPSPEPHGAQENAPLNWASGILLRNFSPGRNSNITSVEDFQ